MKSNKHIIAVVSSLLFWSYATGQSHTPLKGLPGHYVETEQGYLFPIYPGRQGYLAGTMGELRSTHFHSGLDIRTNKQIGAPVVAAQDGYISHISISPVGYGNTLYITHENGQKSVYAHLHTLTGALADSVRAKQYAKQSFIIKIIPEKDKWPVKRGDTIAYSGNSGHSGGPHLHFDIRNADNEPLNPLQFGFKEIVDSMPPIAIKIALQTIDIDGRINGRFGRFEFSLQKNNDHYGIDKPIFVKGRIGIELLTYDKMNGSPFRCGVNYIEVWADTKKIFSQRIEKINFKNTRDILTLINYNVLKKKKQFFNKLYIADGNELAYYEGTKNKGILEVIDKKKQIRIILKDSYGNQSNTVFDVLANDTTIKNIPTPQPLSKTWNMTRSENTLVIRAQRDTAGTYKAIYIPHDSSPTSIKPAYSEKNQHTFLIDMRKNLPDSITIGKKTVRLGMTMVPAGEAHIYRNERVDIEFDDDTLYDTVFISTEYHNNTIDQQEVFRIGTPLYPLKKSMKITLKPTRHYMDNAGVYEIVGKRYIYKGGKWQGGQVVFFSKKFGRYTIIEDNKAPQITDITVNSRQLRFRIRDNLSGIANYTAHINNKWLLMCHDPKKAMIWSDPMDKTNLLKGHFHLEVFDNAGNKSTYKKEIP